MALGRDASNACYWKDVWKKICELRQNSMLCDLTLRSDEGSEFKVHSVILASGSSVLYTHLLEKSSTFLRQVNSNTIWLPGVSADILRVTLDFMYGVLPESISSFKRLRIGAERLGIEGAKRFCVQQLLELELIDATSGSVPNCQPNSSSGKGDLSDGIRKEVDIAKCPYFNNKGTKQKYYVPLKKRFITKMLTDLNHDDLSRLSKQCTSSGSQIRTMSYDQETISSDVLDKADSSSESARKHSETVSIQASFVHKNSASISSASTIDSIARSTPYDQQNGCENNELNEIGDISLLDVGAEFVNTAKEFIPHPISDLSSADYVRCPHLKELISGQDITTEFNETSARDSNQLVFDNDKRQQQDHAAKGTNHMCMDDVCGSIGKAINENSARNGNLLRSSNSDMFVGDPARRNSVHHEDNTFLPIPNFMTISDVQSRPSTEKPSLLSEREISVFPPIDAQETAARGDGGAHVEQYSNRPHSLPSLSSMMVNEPFVSSLTEDGRALQDYDKHQRFFDTDYLTLAAERSINTAFKKCDYGGDQSPLLTKPLADGGTSTSHTVVRATEDVDTVRQRNSRAVPVAAVRTEFKDTDMTLKSPNDCDHIFAISSRDVTDHMTAPVIPSSSASCMPDILQQTLAVDDTTQPNMTIIATSTPVQPSGSKSSVRVHTCDECPEQPVFRTAPALHAHRLKVHARGRLFSCTDCDYKSPRKKDVQSHMLSRHDKVPPGVRVFSCLQCSYKCIDSNRFSEHTESHSDARTYQCSECDRSYATKRGLRNHLQYHSNERPHVCSVCAAAFKVKAKLRDHMKLMHVNKGQKPFECGHCSFRAAVRGNVNQHIRLRHRGLPVLVIDTEQSQRRQVKEYDYASLRGEFIETVTDARPSERPLKVKENLTRSPPTSEYEAT